MQDSPQRDWQAYDRAVRQHEVERVRAMTPQQKFDEHCQLYSFATRGRLGTDEWNRIEQIHFEQKLKIRLKMVKAFQALDELRRERASD